jgi:SAM-dependent methyltransferase
LLRHFAVNTSIAAGDTRAGVARLNWGCGSVPVPRWINSDRLAAPGVDLPCDIRHGLPVRESTFEYVVAMHALQDVPYLDVVPVLRELRRVLKPGGVLRLGLPDLDRAVQAYVRGDRGYYYIPDDEVTSLGGKLAVQIVWYSSVRTPFTRDFVEELLGKASFREVAQCKFRHTASRWPEIVELDNREHESLFVEAVK